MHLSLAYGCGTVRLQIIPIRYFQQPGVLSLQPKWVKQIKVCSSGTPSLSIAFE
jgi:hypothetical protein